MQITDFPGCCTSSILFSFGEHGEESIVTVDEIQKLCSQKMRPEYNELGVRTRYVEKTCFAISVNPENIKTLKEAGFKEMGYYDGIQGRVKILARGLLAS
jgi:hypothetical protein